MAMYLDPGRVPDPDGEDRRRAVAGEVEVRPARRVAVLGTRSLACPSCGVPIALAGPIGWRESIACAFCEAIAPTSDYVQARGWPEVDVIAHLGS